jgi:hypothetical protein
MAWHSVHFCGFSVDRELLLTGREDPAILSEVSIGAGAGFTTLRLDESRRKRGVDAGLRVLVEEQSGWRCWGLGKFRLNGAS